MKKSVCLWMILLIVATTVFTACDLRAWIKIGVESPDESAEKTDATEQETEENDETTEKTDGKNPWFSNAIASDVFFLSNAQYAAELATVSCDVKAKEVLVTVGSEKRATAVIVILEGASADTDADDVAVTVASDGTVTSDDNGTHEWASLIADGLDWNYTFKYYKKAGTYAQNGDELVLVREEDTSEKTEEKNPWELAAIASDVSLFNDIEYAANLANAQNSTEIKQVCVTIGTQGRLQAVVIVLEGGSADTDADDVMVTVTPDGSVTSNDHGNHEWARMITDFLDLNCTFKYYTQAGTYTKNGDELVKR